MATSVDPNSEQCNAKIKKPSLLTLIVLISFGSIGAALFTPAIPVLMEEFDVSAGIAQLSIMIFLLGYCIGQLIYSPLAKRFGRKPALYTGLSISLVGSILSVLSYVCHSFSFLIWTRFIAALGASVGLSLTFMIISDVFYETHARRVTAYTMVAFAVVPGIAIALGGGLVTYLGWVSCFYFLILYTLLALFLVYKMKETSKEKLRDATKLEQIYRNYLRDFRCSFLTLYSSMMGLTTALIYIFAATAPIIAIRKMGLTPAQFGLFNLIPATGFFLGNFLAARLATYFEIKTVLKQGLVLIGVGIVTLFICFLSGWMLPLTLFLPTFVIYFGVPLFFSNSAVLATFRAPDKVSASSTMSFINMGGAVIGVGLMELLHCNPIYTMPTLFLAIFIGIITLFILAERIESS